MEYPNRHKPPFCDDNPIDCHFEVGSHPAGETVRNDDTNINYLIFSRSGHAWITSTLSHDEIPCADEMIFVPRGSECSDIGGQAILKRFMQCDGSFSAMLFCGGNNIT